MKVESDGTDYHITLSRQELEEVLQPTGTLGGFKYGYLQTHPQKMGGAIGEELVGVWPSNDCSCVREPDGIRFERDELGPLFRIHTRNLDRLLKGTAPFLFSRYDGQNKVIISLDDQISPYP